MNELSQRARELIATVGEDDGPAPGTRDRVRRSLVATLAATGTTIAGAAGVASGAPAAGAAGGAGLAAGAAAAGSKLTATVALWLVAGSAVGLAVATPALMSAEKTPAVVVSARPAAPPEPVKVAARQDTAADPIGAPPLVQDTVVGEPQTAARAQSGEARTPIAVESAGRARLPSVSAEVALLQDAQRALAGGDAARALRLLDQHAQLFPGGALVAERMAARVFGLCELGRVEEARRAAGQFLRLHPDSPLVPRVLGSCNAADPAPR